MKRPSFKLHVSCESFPVSLQWFISYCALLCSVLLRYLVKHRFEWKTFFHSLLIRLYDRQYLSAGEWRNLKFKPLQLTQKFTFFHLIRKQIFSTKTVIAHFVQTFRDVMKFTTVFPARQDFNRLNDNGSHLQCLRDQDRLEIIRERH